MKRLLILAALVGFGLFAWQIGSRLSPDAIGLAIGVVFGVLAGIPAALLVLASGRRRAEREEEEAAHARRQRAYAMQPYGSPQPPVIVLAAPPVQQASNGYGGFDYPVRHALPGPTGQTVDHGRVFKLVGEEESIIDEF
ncbi:MAG: hypothetical protein H3C34_11750 [Caldilineaceae bacterium]|nr:hypothetical protein [Caldilineaceae bacterium]